MKFTGALEPLLLACLVELARRLPAGGVAVDAGCNDGTGLLQIADAMPRTPTPAALAAACEGISQFAALSEEERQELPGSLPWLLFSPTTRAGTTNPVFAQVEAFAPGSLNPATGRAYPIPLLA